MKFVSIVALLALIEKCDAFQAATSAQTKSRSFGTATKLNQINDDDSSKDMDRRKFGLSSIGWMAAGAMTSFGGDISGANAEVFFDPEMYGDQELRVGTVDTVRERARRAILQKPSLAPAFYQLALLDGLSFSAKDQKFGPNGGVIYAVLNAKNKDSEYISNLNDAALVLIQAEKDLRRKTAVSIADCVAIAGAEAIESIGGPVLPVQLGRMEVDKSKVKFNPNFPLDILSGDRSKKEVLQAFRSAGLTEREMTVLLSGLLTLQLVEKNRTTEDWKQSVKPKFVERGKMGRMRDFKKLTEEDIQAAADDEFAEDPDDGWYISDSFGAKDERFGQRLGKDQINEKNFNVYVKELVGSIPKKKPAASDDAKQVSYGWIGELILDPDTPISQAWLKKYADSNLYYIKDLSKSFNSITQLGAVYTGGKYENLLQNRPRKSLNSDDLNIF